MKAGRSVLLHVDTSIAGTNAEPMPPFQQNVSLKIEV
jgi:hypothetical protein